jgi:excisionase family DNA binding protein
VSVDLSPVPRLALSVEEACESLGVSWDFWSEHIAPEVRVVRRGRRKLIPVAALAAWLEDNADALGLDTRSTSKTSMTPGVRASRAPASERAA